MRPFRTSLKKHHIIIIFLSILILIGLFSGIVYFNLLDETIITNIKTNITNLLSYNEINTSNLIIHFIIVAIILALSFIGLGFLVGIFTIFYESFSIGFNIAAFYTTYNFNGLIYGTIYNILFKSLYLLLLLIISIKSFNITRRFIGYIITKKDKQLKELIINDFIKVIKLTAAMIINEIFLIVFANKVMHIFSFLIKQ